jgi:tight adherence protein B
VTPSVWLLLAVGLLCAPAPTASAVRLGGLATSGRLAVVPPAHRARRRRRVEPAGVAVIACVGAAVTVAWTCGVALAVAAGIVTVTGWTMIGSMMARRHDVLRRRSLLAGVRLLALELEAGSRPAAALTAAAGASTMHAESFAAAARVAHAGGDVGEALATGPNLAALGRAWHVAAVAGVPLANVLGRVATDLAADDDQRRHVASALAGPRSSAALLAGLPVLGIALGAAMGARPLAVLFGTPAGRLLCCVGVLLDATGVLWTHRLMRRAERP